MTLRSLFVDLNSFFASVEQQCRPGLRGRAVGVAPLLSDSTCCIAASYEAKASGVRTGTGVREARRLCPGIVIVEARPGLYVEFHRRVLRAAERVLPVDGVHSIDEFSCRLLGLEREPGRAVELARAMKESIREGVGECMTCSVGVAPNRFLAKVATGMEKPDGLVVIREEELPRRLHGLGLRDLPGIGARMEARLRSRGIGSVERLCACSASELVSVWESVVGRAWWHMLRGEEVEAPPARRRSVGHQHVLAPELRRDSGARAVLVRLLHKAASRLRGLGMWARQMTVGARYECGGRWKGRAAFEPARDTLSLMGPLGRLWASRQPGVPKLVFVTLHDLVPDGSVTGELYGGAAVRGDLAAAMDRVNAKYGAGALYVASMHEARGSAPTRIAFGSIPDSTWEPADKE